MWYWFYDPIRLHSNYARNLDPDRKDRRVQGGVAALPELSLQIVEFAREHGRVTIGEAIKLTGASRNTLKQHFRALVERGHLNQHGSGRGVWYELRLIFCFPADVGSIAKYGIEPTSAFPMCPTPSL